MKLKSPTPERVQEIAREQAHHIATPGLAGAEQNNVRTIVFAIKTALDEVEEDKSNEG